MIEDSKVVKSIQVKAGGKSGTYWTVTWQDGKTDNIFNGDWLPLLEQSQAENRPLQFTKEKSGNFYNIKSLELVELPEKDALKTPVTNVLPGESKSGIAPQEKGMWWKEMGECFRAGLFKKDDNAAGTQLWQAYIKQMLSSLGITISKEVQPAKKSHLVEEAKKMGAVEIEEEK